MILGEQEAAHATVRQRSEGNWKGTSFMESKFFLMASFSNRSFSTGVLAPLGYFVNWCMFDKHWTFIYLSYQAVSYNMHTFIVHEAKALFYMIWHSDPHNLYTIRTQRFCLLWLKIDLILKYSWNCFQSEWQDHGI